MRKLLVVCSASLILLAAATGPGSRLLAQQAAPGSSDRAPANAAPAPAAAAQTPADPAPVQGPTFRTGVDLVTVDVAVVDNRGDPVADLRAPDFAVKIDGEMRRVVSAELVRVDVEAARRQVADKTETFFTSNLTPPNGRQIVLAVDQMNIRPGALKPVLAAASKFLDHLSPLDQVAFITYPEPGPRVGFTSDKLRLRLAMQSLIGQQSRMMQGQYNIGASEAMAINDKRDQLAISAVAARECFRNEASAREQCQREIVTEAAQIARRVREDADQSLLGLRQLLERLTTVDGPKSLILISEGLAVDETGDLRSIVALAGAARTSINVMLVDLQRGDVTITERPPTELEDRRIQVRGLENLAMMSRGSLYHVAGTGEPIFDRLASEISAYYLLGVEQRAGDLQGDRHRIDVDVRRRGVTVRSRQAFVLSAAAPGRKSTEERLREALESPFAISGVPLRVTTFAQQDPAGDKVRIVVSAHVGQPGTAPAPYTIGYLLIDAENRVAGSFAAKRTLASGTGAPTEPLEFVGGVAVDPGIYSLRVGVVDEEGRRGSIVREVNAWKMAGEALAMGDLIVGSLPAAGQGLRASVEPHVSADVLAAYMELYSTTAETFARAAVTFEIAEDADAPALAQTVAELRPGAKPTWRGAAGVLPLGLLPAGRYVARAQIDRDGTRVGVLARPFVLEKAAAAIGTTPAAAPVLTLAALGGAVPPFERDAVLRRDVLDGMLDVVARRSPALADAVTEARAGRYGPAALEALGAGDQEAAAFLRGIDLYAKGQLDQAAVQFQLAAGPRREFFPAAFYLGACYAAAGRDRDAAGVWQMALGTVARPPAAYVLAADARLRDNQPGSAIDILRPAYAATPQNDDIARRLALVFVATGRHAEALPVLDAYLARQPADADVLFAAIVAHHELTSRGSQALSNVERAKLRRFANAYKGPREALVAKYLTDMQVR